MQDVGLERMRVDDPLIDWPALSEGYGVPCMRATTCDELKDALRKAMTHTEGPVLIEMRLS